ncbi:nuclear transport factor 2 family protein [Celerinatantimonas yamalensis]|uniref:Nuclear transport factor 2 family protein n=1 Tax=Celerinatantimonas yamalensis TaxID=559956 RepID=A0ABW9G4S6_9GAMM
MNETMLIEQLQTHYQRLSQDNLGELMTLYDKQVEFCDPLHQIHGKSALEAYFRQLLKHTRQCLFTFHDSCINTHQAQLSWTMTFNHPRLAGGQPIELAGCSWLHFNQTITWHRDYFDVSAMLHDHLPLVGGVSRWLKKRAGQ